VGVINPKGWRVAFFGCAAAVLVLALIPIPQALPGTGWDKADHLLIFVVMGLLGSRAFPANLGRCMLGLLAYGIAIELLQALVPYRAAEWRDVVADARALH
jgi:hypothetical protein